MDNSYEQILKNIKRRPGRPRKIKIQDHSIREVQVQYKRIAAEMFKVRHDQDVANFLRRLAFDNSREHFFALYLDGSHKVACYSLIALGAANSCPVHPREVFQRGVICGAISIVLAHNHPSGELVPSEADWYITKKLKSAGDILGITVLDHVIFSDHSSMSMRESHRWDG